MRTAVKYPNSVVSDSGSEFINTKFIEFCRNNSIKCSQNFTSIHAPYVERYNRSIKNKIYAFMDGNNTERFIDVLPDIINTYNNTMHRMIGMTPIEAEKKENHSKVRNMIMMYQSKVKKQNPKYKRGQTVRITIFPNKFQGRFEVQKNKWNICVT